MVTSSNGSSAALPSACLGLGRSASWSGRPAGGCFASKISFTVLVLEKTACFISSYVILGNEEEDDEYLT
jgi:hypothetical protein